LLQKFLPGKPWVIPVAFFGIFYGFMTQGTAMKTTILANAYPEMLKNPSVMNTSFYNAKNLSTKILIIGSIKVTFIAVLETLISARIADNLTDTRFDQN